MSNNLTYICTFKDQDFRIMDCEGIVRTGDTVQTYRTEGLINFPSQENKTVEKIRVWRDGKCVFEWNAPKDTPKPKSLLRRFWERITNNYPPSAP